ncbi:hypothetical protein EJ08DRAFT_600272, partial [Tothia fuscella]
LIITSDGRLGLGPARVQPDDEVWLLPGSRVPFVLRKTSCVTTSHLTSRTYELVGECYVHGIMHGEACSEENAGMGGMDELVLV